MTKILVVEDNKLNLELFVYLLGYYGYDLITATDGEEAIKKAKEEKPDLIICDIQLPKLNGYEVARTLKNDPDLKKVPLISVTAYAMVGDRDKIRAAGFDAYIPKPINPGQFVIQIESLLPPHLRLSHTQDRQPAFDILQQESGQKNAGSALIVGDYLDIINLFKGLLESIGFDVRIVNNVKTALEEMEKERVDIIFSELHLSETSGIELLKVVRLNASYAHLPFIIFSAAHPTVPEIKEMKSFKLTRFISLPIDSQSFTHIVKNINIEAPSHPVQ